MALSGRFLAIHSIHIITLVLLYKIEFLRVFTSAEVPIMKAAQIYGVFTPLFMASKSDIFWISIL